MRVFFYNTTDIKKEKHSTKERLIKMIEIKKDVYSNDFYEMTLERDEEGFITKANVVAMSERLPELTCRFYDAKWYCDIKYQASESIDELYIKCCKIGQDTSVTVQNLLNALEEDSVINHQVELIASNY